MSGDDRAKLQGIAAAYAQGLHDLAKLADALRKLTASELGGHELLRIAEEDDDGAAMGICTFQFLGCACYAKLTVRAAPDARWPDWVPSIAWGIRAPGGSMQPPIARHYTDNSGGARMLFPSEAQRPQPAYNIDSAAPQPYLAGLLLRLWEAAQKAS